MADNAAVFPMQAAWKLALGMLGIVGLMAMTLAGLELAGIVEPGAVLGEASQGERIAAVVFGVLLMPFTISAWRNARLTLTDDTVSFLRFGFVCRTESIPLRDIRRWGKGHEKNRGYRHLTLLLELQDLSQRGIKLEMYSRQREFLTAFAERVGPPADASAGFIGMRFEDQR